MRRAASVTAALALAAVSLVGAGARADDLFVHSSQGIDVNPSGPNDCLLSGNPCKTIQHAIDQSGNFDVIKLATGTYSENLVHTGGLPALLTIQGGWNSSFVSRSQVATRTVINGGQNGQVFDLDAEAVLLDLTVDGLTLRGGAGVNGGAIRAYAHSGDEPLAEAGSILLRLRNVRIHDSTATTGGAIWAMVEFNIGAILQKANYIQLEIFDSVIEDNSATDAGGVYLKNLSGNFAVVIEDTVIRRNTAADGWGALYVESEEPDATGTLEMRRNVIVDNVCTGDSGGIHIEADVLGRVTATLENNVIASNEGNACAQGLCANTRRLGSIELNLLNDTIADNGGVGMELSTANSGGEIAATVTNVILSANALHDLILGSEASTTATYSNVGVSAGAGSYTAGPGVFNQAPLFVDPTALDYHLQPDSPGVDGGICGKFSPGYERIAPLEDFDGDPRPAPEATFGCDIGADEVPPAPPDGVLNFVEAVFDGASGVDGLNGAAGVAASPDGKDVYVASGGDHAVAAFRRNEGTGQLDFVEFERNGRGVTGLLGAADVAVSPDGLEVFVVGELDDAIAGFRRIAATGALNFRDSRKNDVGGVQGLDGPVAVAVSPDSRHVYVASEDDGAVAVFSHNQKTGVLTFVEAEFDGARRVDGLFLARDVTVSPDGQHVYTAAFGDSAVTVFSRNQATGALTFVEVQKQGVGPVKGLSGAWSVAVSPDGANVYAVATISDSVVVFLRNSADGRLSFVDFVQPSSEEFDTPFSVVVSPGGNYVYVAARQSDSVTAFRRNLPLGTLTLADLEVDGSDGVDGLDGAAAVAATRGGQVYVAGQFDGALVAFIPEPELGLLRAVALATLAIGVGTSRPSTRSRRR